jgi:hypothetical protein
VARSPNSETRRFALKLEMSQASVDEVLRYARERADDKRVLGAVQDDGSWVLWWVETAPPGEFIPPPEFG